MFLRDTKLYENKQVIEDARSLVTVKERGLLPISQTDHLEIYSDGYPIVNLNNKEYDVFDKSFDKYLEEMLASDRIKALRQATDKRSFIMEDDILEALIHASKRCDPNNAERRSEQFIALKHQSYSEDKFTICGIETTISADDLKGTTRGEGKQIEIDMVAIRPSDKKIYIIEYKCGQGTLGRGMNASLNEWNFKGEEKIL